MSDLLIRLKLDAAGLDAQMKGVSSKFSAFAKGIAAVAAPVALAGAVYKTVDALAAVGESAIRSISPLQDMAERLGVTAERLQELRLVGQQAGVEFEQMDQALTILNRTIGQAALGQGTFEKTLAKVGISLKNSQGQVKSVSTIYDELSKKIASGSLSQAESIALASAAFGRGGAAIVNALKMTAEQQKAVIDNAREFGAIISNEVVASADEYGDKLDLIKKGTAALGAQNDIVLAPLTLGWAKLKNEVAMAAAQALRAAGLIDDNATLQRDRMKDIGAQMLRLNESVRVTGMNDSVRAQLKTLYAEYVELNKKIRQTEEAARAAAAAMPAAQNSSAGAVESDDEAKERERKERLAAEEAKRIEQEAADYKLQLVTSVYAEKDRLALEEIEKNREYEQIMFEERERFAQAEIEAERELQQALLEERQRVADIDIESLFQKEGVFTEARRQGAEDRAKFDQMEAGQRVATTLGALAKITAGTAQQSKKMFELNKLAAIATAIINTAQGATKALAQGGFAGIAQAAAVIAAGTAQIAAIRKTQFQGGGGGTTPSAVGTTSVVNGAPVNQQVITVKGIDASQLFTGRQIVDLLNEATKNGAKLVLAQ